MTLAIIDNTYFVIDTANKLELFYRRLLNLSGFSMKWFKNIASLLIPILNKRNTCILHVVMHTIFHWFFSALAYSNISYYVPMYALIANCHMFRFNLPKHLGVKLSIYLSLLIHITLPSHSLSKQFYFMNIIGTQPSH